MGSYCDKADYLETVYKEDGVVELIESKFGNGWPAIEEDTGLGKKWKTFKYLRKITC